MVLGLWAWEVDEYKMYIAGNYLPLDGRGSALLFQLMTVRFECETLVLASKKWGAK